MHSFEEIPDTDVLKKTLIQAGVTGGEEDPDFVPTALDRLVAVNKPKGETCTAGAAEGAVAPNIVDIEDARRPTPPPEQRKAA